MVPEHCGTKKGREIRTQGTKWTGKWYLKTSGKMCDSWDMPNSIVPKRYNLFPSRIKAGQDQIIDDSTYSLPFNTYECPVMNLLQPLSSECDVITTRLSVFPSAPGPICCISTVFRPREQDMLINALFVLLLKAPTLDRKFAMSKERM